MRIIAFTDIHGAYDRIEETLLREPIFDVIVIGGDLTTHGTVGQAEAVIQKLRKFDKPILAVAGNMDSPEFDSSYDSLGINLNGRGTLLGDTGFFGVAGSPFTPMNTPYEIAEEEIKRRAETGWQDVQSARWKIFVPHAPPRNTKLDRIVIGKHVGSTALREFVELHQPDVLICGHIHEARGMDSLGQTQMVNCGAGGRGYYARIDIADRITIQLCG